MAGPCSFQDLSSPAKDRTHAPLQWKCRALTTRLVGYPSRFLCLNPTSSSSAASNYLQVLSVFLSFFFFFLVLWGRGGGCLVLLFIYWVQFFFLKISWLHPLLSISITIITIIITTTLVQASILSQTAAIVSKLVSLLFRFCLLCMCVFSVVPVLFDSLRPMDYSPPGSSVHGILHERVLE